jgi:hypothetical protein
VHPFIAISIAVLALGAARAQTAVDRLDECSEALTHPKEPAEHFLPTPLSSLLERISRACAAELPHLSRAAAEAAPLPQEARSRILGDAAAAELGNGCRPLWWEHSAAQLDERCRLELPDAVSVRLLSQADAGTALFASALWTHLKGSRDERLSAFVRTLLLATALEAEASRTR